VNIIRKIKYNFYLSICLTGFVLFSFVLSGCSEDSIDNTSTDGMATITIFAGETTTRLASRAVSGLPSIATRVDVSVFDGEDVLGSGDLLVLDSLSIRVPPGVELTVTGTAFADTEVIFQGQTIVAPLRAGVKTNVNLSLRPVGPLTSRFFEEPVQVDITNEGIVGNLTADVDPGFVFYDDNKKILFSANSTNLSKDDDNNARDIFSRNFISGEISNLHSSVDGVLADADVMNAVINTDGQTVAFTSAAANLVADDTNGVVDLFIKNTETGIVTRILDPNTNQELVQAVNSRPNISNDGKRVVIKLTDNTNSNEEIYLFDFDAATFNSFGPGQNPVISGDGKFIAKISFTANAGDEIIYYDVTTTVPLEIARFLNPRGLKTMSRNGNFIAFLSDFGEGVDILRLDFAGLINETVNITIKDNFLDMISALSEVSASFPSMSSNGRYIAFGLGTSIFIKDMRCNGELKEVTAARWPAISPDGELIAYLSTDNNALFVAANPALNQPGTCNIAQ